MSLNLNSILKRVINEGVSSKNVRKVLDGSIDGIDNNGKPKNIDKNGNPFYHYVRITYDDTLDNPKADKLPKPVGDRLGVRIIQPYALGDYIYVNSKTGRKKRVKLLRAYQISPQSRRGGPRWDLFRLDRITSWEPILTKTFNYPAEGYNSNGDNTMSKIDVQVKFNNYHSNNDEFSQAINRPGAIKQQTDNIKNSPKVTSGNIGQTDILNQRKRVAGKTYKNSKRDNMIYKNINLTKNFDRFNDSVWDKANSEKMKQDYDKWSFDNQTSSSGPIKSQEDDDDINDWLNKPHSKYDEDYTSYNKNDFR